MKELFKKIFPFLFLVIVTLIAFSPSLQARFVNLDDDGHVVNNPAVSGLTFQSIAYQFSQTLNRTYVPLTTLSFAIEDHFFGLNAFVFHLDNLLLHMGVVLMVFLLSRRFGLSAPAALFSALIFAIHPMRVESVAWVTERKDLLYSFFYLLALHQYWTYLKTKSFRPYLVMVLLGFLSMLAKPMAFSLPLVLFLLDWLSGRAWEKKVIFEKLPVFIYTLGIGWITFALNPHHPLKDLVQGALIWIWSFDFYIWKFLWPVHVNPYYLLPEPVSICHWPYAMSVLMFVVILLGIWKWRRQRLWIFAWGYYFLSIFFLLRFGHWGFNIVADRFMYLPSLGFCLLLGTLADRCLKTRWVMIPIALIFIFLEIQTSAQCHLWHDSKTFWDGLIDAYPREKLFFAYNNRGNLFFEQGQLDQALADYNTALSLNPKAFKTYCNRGLVFARMGRYNQAIADYNKAIALNNTFTTAYTNRSLAQQSIMRDNGSH